MRTCDRRTVAGLALLAFAASFWQPWTLLAQAPDPSQRDSGVNLWVAASQLAAPQTASFHRRQAPAPSHFPSRRQPA